MPEPNIVQLPLAEDAPKTTGEKFWHVVTVTYRDPLHTLCSGLVYLVLAAGWGALYNWHLLDWIKAAIATFHLSFGGSF